jgi:transcription initiation factor TFIIIB Brf1 subunit/transcription initiation factor TFIIB
MTSTTDEFEIFEQFKNVAADVENLPPLTPPTHSSTSPEASSESECPHLNRNTEMGKVECLDCGLELRTLLVDSGGDGERYWAPRPKSKGIKVDLEGIFPDPIISKTSDIFENVTEGAIFRIDRRRSIIAACVMEAYKILKIPITQQEILNRYPVTNINTGVKMVEMRIKKFDTERVRKTYTSPEESIRDILDKWEDGSNFLHDVIELYRQVEGKSNLINRARAKSVAAAVIYYFILAMRKNTTITEFCKAVELSSATIIKLAREVSAVMQTPEILSY